MTLALITLPVVATLALAMLSALWVLTTNREMGRLRRRRTLRLAARLRAELSKELGRLEARNHSLRVRAASDVAARRAGTSLRLIGPELIEDLHATLLTDIRHRVDQAYRGIQFGRGPQQEARCKALEEITREVGLLAAEIDGRETAHSTRVLLHPASRRPGLRLERAA
jgi:hypothetical protein